MALEPSTASPLSSRTSFAAGIARRIGRLSDRQAIAATVAFLCLLYIPFVILMSTVGYSYLPGDCPYYRAAIVSLLQDHDLYVANNVAADPLNGQLALGSGGLVPKHPILMPVVSLPFYALLGDLGLLVFNMLDVLTLMVLLYLLNRLFFDLPVALVTTLLYGTLSLFPAYAYNYSPDVFSTVLVVGGLYAFLTDRRFVSGCLLGLSVFAKLPNVVPVGLVACYALAQAVHRMWVDRGSPSRSRHLPTRDLTMLLAFVVGVIVALIPLALANYHLYGSVFASGYERTVAARSDGMVRIIRHTGMFQQPALLGTLHVLFDPRKGVLLTNPVMLLAFVGATVHRRGSFHGPEFLLIGAICVAQLLFFGTYDEWASSSYSNRFLMTPIALSSVFTATFIAWARGRGVRARSPKLTRSFFRQPLERPQS